jgi:hypothetical protein
MKDVEEKNKMKKNLLIGTWTLVSVEVRNTNGMVSYPWGQAVRGYITYGQDGYMSVSFMSTDRPNFQSNDLRGGSVEEKVSAFDTYFSYCGKYEIRGEKVVHHIEVSLYPNWTGVDQERFYTFDGDRLILSTPPVVFENSEQTGYLIWQRA